MLGGRRKDVARPTKKRRVCALPGFTEFYARREDEAPAVYLTVEEYETVRLMDYFGLTQQECAAEMEVARTTVQALYVSARKRIAAALVEGRPLLITGGSYTVCPAACRCGRAANGKIFMDGNGKGRSVMKIAVTYEHGTIFQHFGKTSQFKVYEVADGKVASSEVIDTNGQGHGALAFFLKECGVDTLICGGIGGGAQQALQAAGITLYGGVQGEADAAVDAFLAGKLAYDPAVHCSHHAGHGEGHGHCHGHGAGGCGSH